MLSHSHQITRPALLGGQRKPSACISSSSYQVAQTNQCHGMQYITVTMSLQNSLFHKSASLMGAGLRDHCYVSLLPALSCGVWGLTPQLWSVRCNSAVECEVELSAVDSWICNCTVLRTWSPKTQPSDILSQFLVGVDTSEGKGWHCLRFTLQCMLLSQNVWSIIVKIDPFITNELLRHCVLVVTCY